MHVCGLDSERIASVRSPGTGRRETDPKGEGVRQKLIETAAACVREDGADTIILGCLSFAGMAGEIAAATGVPVVDPALAAVLTAQSLVRMGLSHSKKAYAFPETK